MGIFGRRKRPPTQIRHGQRFSASEFVSFMDQRREELVQSNVITRPVELAFTANVPYRDRDTWLMQYPLCPVHVVVQDDRVSVFRAEQVHRPVELADLRYFIERDDIKRVRFVDDPDKRLRVLDGDELLLGETRSRPLLVIDVPPMPPFCNPEAPWPQAPSAFRLVLTSEPDVDGSEEQLRAAYNLLTQ